VADETESHVLEQGWLLIWSMLLVTIIFICKLEFVITPKSQVVWKSPSGPLGYHRPSWLWKVIPEQIGRLPTTFADGNCCKFQYNQCIEIVSCMGMRKTTINSSTDVLQEDLVQNLNLDHYILSVIDVYLDA
jgi:hypothetical protein